MTQYDGDVIFPETLDDAFEALSVEGARIVAGGTDLVPNLKRGSTRAKVLVSLARVAGLDKLEVSDDRLRIGAGVTIARLARDSTIRVLSRAAAMIASPQIRNTATIGGNLCLDTRCVYINQSEFWREANGLCLKTSGSTCHVVEGGRSCVAASLADLPPVLVALDASIEIASRSGLHTISLDQLYSNNGASPVVLAPDQIVTAVTVPLDPTVRASYRKLRVRDAIDFALIGLALAIAIEDGRCRSVRVVAGGVAPGPRRVKLDDLQGMAIDGAFIERVADRALHALRPIETIGVDRSYRRAMVPVLVRDAFDEMRLG
jgi:4-hydroxybenzoyl-CoA reductase subunit beta